MNAPSSPSEPPSPRARLLRQAAVLQLKLIADGLRDAALIPISFFAAVIGLIRGGDEADREFRQVIKLGKRSERWINLFGHHQPTNRSHPAGSLDTLIDKVEDVVREQYQKGRTSKEAKVAIDEALQMVHRATEQVSATGKNNKQ